MVDLIIVRIVSDYGANTVQLDGDTFETNGKLFRQWKTVAIGIKVKERTLFFSWEGTRPILSPGESFKGFGQCTFKDVSGICDRGDGLFAEFHMGRKKAALWKSVELRRVDMADRDRIAEVMKNGSDSTRASEVMKALHGFTGAGGQGI